MKLNLWRTIFVCALLIAAAIPVGAQGGSGENFTWEEYDLSLTYPAGWTAQNAIDQLYAFSSGEIDLSSSTIESPLIMVAFDDPAGSLFGSGIVTESLEETAQNWANMVLRELAAVEATKLAGLEAIRIDGIEDLTGAPISAVMTFDPEGRLLFIAAIAPEDQWEALVPVFDALLESVRFGEAEALPDDVPQSADLPDTSAESGAWRVVSATPITLPENAPPLHMIFPAPDGRHMAYNTRGDDDEESMCSLDVITGDETCVLLPTRFGPLSAAEPLFWSARWSPDSTRMTLIGRPLFTFIDMDLSVVDFQNGTSSILIDDGYEDNLLPSNMTPETSVEVQPVWSPDGSTLVFERTVLGEDGRLANSTLSLIDVATGEIHDLSTLPGSDAFEMDLGSVVGLDWSPDGSTLAVSIAHRNPEPLYDGLWLMDMESGEWERLVTLDDVQEVYLEINAEYQGEIRYLLNLAWSPDGERLLFWMIDGSMTGTQWFFWADVETGQVIPAPLPPNFPDQGDSRMIYPTQALWSPDGMILVAARMLTPLPGETIVPLDPADPDSDEVSLRLIDPETGESTLFGYLPLVPTNPGVAAWGPDGNVLIDGYHLEMEHE